LKKKIFLMEKTLIGKEIFQSSMFFSGILLLMFAFFFPIFLYKMEISKAHLAIKHQNQAIKNFIEGYFNEIKNTVVFLADNPNVINGYSSNLNKQNEVLDLYQAIANANKHIKYIYSGYENGFLLIRGYTPPKGFNVKIRPWYKIATFHPGNISIGLPYQEIKTKKWLISASKTLNNLNNKRMVGVISVDCSIDNIVNLLATKNREYKTCYSFVTKMNGEIIIHNKKQYLKKILSKVVKKNIVFKRNIGSFSYNLNSKNKIAYYSHITGLDWVVITVVMTDEIIMPIIYKIVISVIFIALLFIAFGIIQSRFLGKRFSSPMIALQQEVNDILKGKWNKSNYRYPKNEIGMIAEKISKLTEQEIQKKIIQLQKAYDDVNYAKYELEKSFQELNRVYKEIREDIFWAKRIQENILSDKLIVREKVRIQTEYLPMSEIGGDIYNITELNNGKIRIFLADATGHGIQASLITMLIKSEYEKIKKDFLNTSDLMKTLNNKFIENYGNLTVFFTAIVLDIDIKNFSLSYTSAGHPVQYLVKNDRVIMIKGSGKMIGVLKDVEYSVNLLEISSDDKIFLLTDGLYEEFNENSEEFGERRLYEFLTIKKDLPMEMLIAESIDCVKEFLGNEDFQDDITVIGIDFN